MIVVAVVIKHHRIRGPLQYIASALITLYDACTDLIGSVAASFTKGKRSDPLRRRDPANGHRIREPLRCMEYALITLYDVCTDLIGYFASSLRRARDPARSAVTSPQTGTASENPCYV
ncbi:hypothetical protein B296_00014872 [Ensete ventricosum]|uniref:Uncharacterized protein n=1 Tax=Ensete ventricosum TaxID=4639 RepID=A0A427AXY2_ENSVE|nr:hypothetical protein B296_00014872 [Ensete ventricosum]